MVCVPESPNECVFGFVWFVEYNCVVVRWRSVYPYKWFLARDEMTVDDDEPNSQPSAETMSQNSEDTNIGFLPSWK